MTNLVPGFLLEIEGECPRYLEFRGIVLEERHGFVVITLFLATYPVIVLFDNSSVQPDVVSKRRTYPIFTLMLNAPAVHH